MQVTEVEPPTVFLPPTMLAHQAIEPAIQPAGQIEIGPVDGEDQGVIQNRTVEPVGHDHLDAVRAAIRIGPLMPFVDPRKAMPPSVRALADRGRNRGRLQAVQRRFQTLIVPQGCSAPCECQDLIGRCRHQARRAQTGVPRFHDLAGRPDQYIGVPDRRHTVIGNSFDTDRDVAQGKVNRADTVRFGKGKERIGHEILRVSWSEFTGKRPKQIELSAFRGGWMRGRHQGLTATFSA